MVCPDTIGRGLSQWAAPGARICLDFYAWLARELLVDWTSPAALGRRLDGQRLGSRGGIAGRLSQG